jgi:hypothetical protein
MNKYTIEAFNVTPIGGVNVIRVVVQAKSEDEAMIRARKLVVRSDYSVVCIEELDQINLDLRPQIKKKR